MKIANTEDRKGKVMDIIFVSVFAFVFVAVAVGGWRALNIIEARKAQDEAARRLRAIRKANGTAYTGAIYSRFGNEIEE